MKPLHLLVIAAALLVATRPALAMYKVVQADGSVTYTDRAPVAGNAKVTPLGRAAQAGAQTATQSATQAAAAAPAGVVDSALPLALRQVVQRHPVTLYTAANCAPCDDGRVLLQQRGVPYSERRVSTEEDALALERLVGARSIPALSIGSQPLRGYSSTDWAAYLDAAGYPRESRLPRNWPVPTATPLVERVALPVQPQPNAPQVQPPVPAPAAEPVVPGGIRF